MEVAVKHLILSMVICLGLSGLAKAQDIQFISINEIKPDSVEAFEGYQDTIRPIMASHGGDYVSTDIVEALVGDVAEMTVVNFGNMGPMESAQAFFQDAEFQAALPTLIMALEDHYSYTPGGPLPELESDTLVLFVASNASEELDAVSAYLGEDSILARMPGVQAVSGIGPTASPVTPPAELAIWTLSEEAQISANDLSGADIALILKIR